MPNKPTRRRRHPGQGTRPRGRNNARDGSGKLKYGARHRRWREDVLARDPVCKAFNNGRRCIEASTDADHRIAIDTALGMNWSNLLELIDQELGNEAAEDFGEYTEAGTVENWVRYSLFNGQGLCKSCHGRKSQAEGAGFTGGMSVERSR